MEVCVGTSNDKYLEYITNVKNNTAVAKQNWCEKESSGKSTSNNTNTCTLHKNDYISENVRRVPTIDAIGLEAAHSKNAQSLKSDALAHFTKASDNVSNHRYFVFEHNYGSTRNNTKTDKSSETKFGCSAQNIVSTKNHMRSANVENVKHTYVEDLGSEKENRIIFTGGKKNTTSSQQIVGGRDIEGEFKNANCFKLTSPGLLQGSEEASVEGNGVIDEPKPQQKKSDFNSPPGTPKLLKPSSLEGFGSDVSNTNPWSQCDILRLLQEHSGSGQHCTTEKIFHDHTYCKTKISPQSSYFCRLCDKCLEGMDKTMDHLESCHLHVMQCILCPSSFDCRPDLIFHVAKHCPNSLTCEKCQLYFRDKESYERHNETCKCPQTTRHSDKNGTWRSRKTMLCHICGKELIRHSLGSHMRVHNRPNSTVKCKLCNQDFSNKGILQFHMRVHGETYTYNCRLCSKTFSDMDSYRAHISSAHETRYICEICGKACVFKTALYAHRRRFHKPKVKSAPVMVRCEICKKNVSKKEYTTHFKKAHIMTNEERLAAKLRLPNRMCEFCGKIFTYDSLRSHAKLCRESQGNPLRIKCRECDAYFPSSKALRLHMWNLGHKFIYNCRFCLRTFNNQFSYKKHLNSEHEKGYACHLCDKSFVFKASYKSHMRAHNPNYVPKKILVNCELCDKSMTKQYYYKHLIKQHPAS